MYKESPSTPQNVLKLARAGGIPVRVRIMFPLTALSGGCQSSTLVALWIASAHPNFRIRVVRLLEDITALFAQLLSRPREIFDSIVSP